MERSAQPRLSLTSEDLLRLSSGMTNSTAAALRTATKQTRRFAVFMLTPCVPSSGDRERASSEAEDFVAHVRARWAREESASPIGAPPPAAPPPPASQTDAEAFISEKASRQSQEKDTTLPASVSNAESPTLVTAPASVTLPFPSTPPTSPNSPASGSLARELDRRRDGCPSRVSHTSPRIRSTKSREKELDAAREEAMAALINTRCGANSIPCPRPPCTDELRDVEALALHLHIHTVDEQVCLAGASNRLIYSCDRPRARTSSTTPLGAFTGPFRRLAALAVCHRADASTSD